MGILAERLRQKYRTMAYPDGPAPELPERWRGRPLVTAKLSADTAERCPVGAIGFEEDGSPRLDVGRCLFCGACAESGEVAFSREYALARFGREDLVARPDSTEVKRTANPERLALIRSLFGKSLKLREISAGGCNACEADCNVLSTLAWDMGRFGLAFVASPRHADGILVTGPVTDNMRLAVEKTYAAVPGPKVIIAVGACAVSGGLYGDGSGAGVLERLLPAQVDLFVPGCPPHPLTILEGLLRLMGRIPDLPGGSGSSG